MKNKLLAPVLRQLNVKLNGFACKGPMIVAPIGEGILRGFYFEDSGFDRGAYYVWAFVQPLYVPATTINFSLGKRLGYASGTRWKIQQPSVYEEIESLVMNDGIEFIRYATTPGELSDWCASLLHSADPYVLQSHAYSLAAASRYEEALVVVQQLIDNLDLKWEWMMEIANRATILKRIMIEHPSNVGTQLLEWQIKTMRCLKLKGTEK